MGTDHGSSMQEGAGSRKWVRAELESLAQFLQDTFGVRFPQVEIHLLAVPVYPEACG
jgi:hypothetical protein